MKYLSEIATAIACMGGFMWVIHNLSYAWKHNRPAYRTVF